MRQKDKNQKILNQVENQRIKVLRVLSNEKFRPTTASRQQQFTNLMDSQSSGANS